MVGVLLRDWSSERMPYTSGAPRRERWEGASVDMRDTGRDCDCPDDGVVEDLYPACCHATSPSAVPSCNCPEGRAPESACTLHALCARYVKHRHAPCKAHQ